MVVSQWGERNCAQRVAVCQLPLMALAFAGLQMTTDFLPKAVPDSIDSPSMRYAGRELLSLALMDARNHTLLRYAQIEQALAQSGQSAAPNALFNPPDWQLGHMGWFAEWWIGRNMQRHRGRHMDHAGTRLASIETQADHWWRPDAHTRAQRWRVPLPKAEQIRDYLLETLETALELLALSEETDDALYTYRLALFHEDWQCEQLACMAQHAGWVLDAPFPPAIAVREPLWVPATRWNLGHAEQGFAFAQEQAQHGVHVPEFEMDAQPVTWGQFTEFVQDGGYDDSRHWHPQGWAWLQAQADGRRAPRYVEQIGTASAAVIQTRFGQTRRMLPTQPVVHVSWFEADAYARWLGRRLPTEEEWEVAAHTASRRGFVWGQVWEWCSHRMDAYPGYSNLPGQEHVQVWFQHRGERLGRRVLRGASYMTAGRLKHPKYRRAAWPEHDTGYVGFRTCAI
jgi:iron(II)-dependent oxidoreductase